MSVSEPDALDGPDDDNSFERLDRIVGEAAQPLLYKAWLGKPYSEWRAAFAERRAAMLANAAAEDRPMLDMLLRERFYWEGAPFEHKMIDRTGIIVSADPTVDPLPGAFESLIEGLHADRWCGRTYREFWEWFNAQASRVEAMADDDEMDEVGQRLADLRDSAHDAFGIPDDRADEVIGAT